MVMMHVGGLLFLAGIAAAVVSPDNSCGGSNAYTCPGSLCCSQYNWCGVSDAHCGAGCQTRFGTCNLGSSKISPDGTCGGTTGYTCTGSTHGNCCSRWGYCGNTDEHCLNACQSSFGDCSSITVGGKSVSQDGTCGGTAGFTCQGSTYGDCCSQWGYCGKSTDHCGTGCQASFGTCPATGGGAAATTSAARPASTGAKTSPDGSCGGSNGYTCAAGKCCSKNGWCDTTSDYCGFGCQAAFSPGTCSPCPGATCAGTVTGNPTCTANNNYCWTVNSKKFQITCGRLASGSFIASVDATSLGDCISKCAANAACVAASFYQGSSTTCSLLGTYQGPANGNSAGGQQNHAYVRSPNCG
ncbi:Lectin-B [Colletotrichum chlorophyti]|uniref:Lectin-B n=1 Tax=Colletotrichum chlorophyti TaxID=708187 RepID=A0A1Q8RVP1_9PEZI|nr:Lectin-B [Colletotrichum chlorophyti]